jgi:chromosome partitioning protein
VIIPVPAQYLPLKGLEQLLGTVARIQKRINPTLTVGGILLTMLDTRTNYAKDIIAALEANYGGVVNVFAARIPQSVRAAEASLSGQSIFTYDANGKVAAAYEQLTREVLQWDEN